MSKFTDKLRSLVASNRMEEMIRRLMDSLAECERKVGRGNLAVKEIRNKVIQYSAQLNDVRAREARQTLSHEEAQISRGKILTAYLNLIDDFHRYPEYLEFLEDKEEDEAWEEATKLNEIGAYQRFFENYPDGKYKHETRKIIAEIKEIERQAEEDIQRKAQEERDRREREEEEGRKHRDEERKASEAAERRQLEEQRRITESERLALETERNLLADQRAQAAEQADRIRQKEDAQRIAAEKERKRQGQLRDTDRIKAQEKALRKAELKTQMKADKKNFFVPGGGVVKDPIPIPKQEKGLRAWITRNVVVFCNIFIVLYLTLYLGTFKTILIDLRSPIKLGVVVFSILISISLMLSRKGGVVSTIAGWLGLCYIPYLILLSESLGMRPFNSRGYGNREFWFCLGAYFLVVVILGVFARMKAQKELSHPTY